MHDNYVQQDGARNETMCRNIELLLSKFAAINQTNKIFTFENGKNTEPKIRMNTGTTIEQLKITNSVK